jgi:hypothetical protein
MGGIWTYEKLNEYLEDPRGFAKGNRMAFAGLRKAEDRAAVIAYLNEPTGRPSRWRPDLRLMTEMTPRHPAGRFLLRPSRLETAPSAPYPLGVCDRMEQDRWGGYRGGVSAA